MKVSPIPILILALVSFSIPACSRLEAQGNESDEERHHQIVVTSPQAKDVIITQQYVCQIHSRRHIEVCALQDGYLEGIRVKEGQAVKKGDVMFKILPTLYKAKMDAEVAEAELAQIEFDNTRRLFETNVVSIQEVALAQAKLNRANAKANLATAEVNFTTVKAPFDGIVDRLHRQLGSLIEKKDVLTTLSDNSVMWVYFNVPERRYLEHKALAGKGQGNSQQLKLPDSRIELVLADGSTFKYDAADTVTVEGQFNNETGNIPFRADFSNPDGLLRHGQTGAVLIHRTLKNAIVIPQRATFEILDRRYVYVIDKDNVVHQRDIVVQNELDDIFVVKSGLAVNDKFVLEGKQQVHDGQTNVEYEFRKPEEALSNMKHHAE